jgi:hypothetical protein
MGEKRIADRETLIYPVIPTKVGMTDKNEMTGKK